MSSPTPVEIVETHTMQLHLKPFRSLVESKLTDGSKVLVLRGITKDTFLEASLMSTFRGGGYGWADQDLPRFHIAEIEWQEGLYRTSSRIFLLVARGDSFSFTNRKLQTTSQQSYVVQKVAETRPPLATCSGGKCTFCVVHLCDPPHRGEESTGLVYRCVPDVTKRGHLSGLPRYSSMSVHVSKVQPGSPAMSELVPNGIQVTRLFIPTKEIRLVQRKSDHVVVETKHMPTLATYTWAKPEEPKDRAKITGFGLFKVRCVGHSKTSTGMRTIIYQRSEEGLQDTLETSQEGLPYHVYRGLVPFVVVLGTDIKRTGASAYHVCATRPLEQVEGKVATTADATPGVSSHLSALVDKLLDPHNTNDSLQQVLQTFSVRTENAQASGTYSMIQPPLLEVSIHGEGSLPVFMTRNLIQEARCVSGHTPRSLHPEASENTVSENDTLRLTWSRDHKDDVCFLRLYSKPSGSCNVLESVFLYEENLFSAITGLCRQSPRSFISGTEKAPKYRIKGMVKSCNALLRLSMHPKVQVGKGITCGPFSRELYCDFAKDRESLELLGLSVTKTLSSSVPHKDNSLSIPPPAHFEAETHESNAQNFSIANQNVNLGLLIQTTCQVDFAAITQCLQAGVCHFTTLPYQGDSQQREVPTATCSSPWLSTQTTSILNTHGFALEGKGTNQAENRRLEKIDKQIRSLTGTDIQGFVWKRVRHNLYHQLADGYKAEVLCNVRPDISTVLFANELTLQRFKEKDCKSTHGIVAYVFPRTHIRQHALPLAQPYLPERPQPGVARMTPSTQDARRIQPKKRDILCRMEVLMAKVSSSATNHETTWKTLQTLCSEIIFHLNALHAQLPNDVAHLNSNRDRLQIIRRDAMNLCKVHVNNMYATKVKNVAHAPSALENAETALDLQRMQSYLHAHATWERLQRKDIQLPNNFGTCLNFYSSVVL